MKIDQANFLTVAQKVLFAIEFKKQPLISDLYNSSDNSVTKYENGREHGYLISTKTTTICFSEYRNSDDIVVYVSNPGEEFEDGTPTDRAYATKKFFRFDQSDEAAAYISSVIKSAK